MNSKQKTQFFIGIVLIVGTFLWAYLGAQSNYKLGLYLLTGVAIGYVLTRSQYGFAGVIRKLYRMGNADLARAILFLFIITILVMAALQFIAQVKDATVPAMSSVKPNSLLTVLGGLIFGAGMILASGCASGTLTASGKFQIGSFFALAFFCLGSVAGVASLDVLYPTFLNVGPKIYLPDYFGYFGSIVLLGVVFLIIAALLRRYEKSRMKQGTYIAEKTAEEYLPVKTDENTPFSSYPTLHKIFKERWSLYTGSLLLAMLFLTMTITTGKNWGITSTFIYWGGWVLEPLGVDIQSIGYFSNPGREAKLARFVENHILNDAGSLRNIGIFLGAVIYVFSSWSAKASMSWKWRNVISYSIGGFLMGYGARFADGCNVGAFFSAISSFSFSAFVFGACMYLGGYWALKIVNRCKLDV